MTTAPPTIYLTSAPATGGTGTQARPYGLEDGHWALMPLRGKPKTVKLAAGFTGSLTALHGLDWAMGAPGQPTIIDGSEAGLIDTGTAGFIDTRSFSWRPLGNVEFRNIRVTASRRTIENSIGISLTGNWTNTRIVSCDVRGYRMNVVLQGEVAVYQTGMSVAGNVLADSFHIGTDADSSGLLVQNTAGTIVEDNVLDHNGWNEAVPGAVPTIRCHNFYANPWENTGLVVRRNIIARGGASGLRSCGNTCEDNILIDNPTNLIASARGVVVQNNTILGSRDIGTLPRGTALEINAAAAKITGNFIGGRMRTAFHLYGPASADLDGNTMDTFSPDGDAVAVAWNDDQYGPVGAFDIQNSTFRMAHGGLLLSASNTAQVPSMGGNRWYSTTAAPYSAPGSLAPQPWAVWQAGHPNPGDWWNPALPALPGLREFCAAKGKTEPEFYAALRAREPWVGELAGYVRAGVGG